LKNEIAAEITEIVEKYRGVVFRVALGYVKNIHDADDVAQNVFIKLIRKNKTFISEDARKAWLIRVAVNESKNLLKSAWNRKRAELDESLAAPVNNEFGIYEYVKAMKPKYRSVIYLHYYEGYTTKEIAGILKIPQSTVLTQLQRAREMLKNMIIKGENCYGTKIHGII
jgi:RNA polymerase sigma-70 factor (ECF subfamily)